ncbi:MAG: ABC transporter ATP-binding protein, partial [Acidimicrobiia bacterium]|nr:ABC transporter ATP-binding protein [Acidimicrobiia bacterium]
MLARPPDLGAERMDEPAVSITGVTKVYEPSPPLMRMLLRSSLTEPVTALDRVDLEVNKGEVCAVVGPNGAGKSTMFRILTGLTTPTAGSASVLGVDATHESHRVRRLVGFAPAEERTLLLRHTCRENLIFHGQMQGMERRRLRLRIDEVLELVGLAEEADRVGFALSTGMRARLQLARALLHAPQVLILDEPTATVDPVSAHGFLSIIQQIAHDSEVAVLISSHRLEEIAALDGRVHLIDRGRTIFDGDLGELRRRQ